MIWNRENQFFEGTWKNDKINGFGKYIYKGDVSNKKPIRNYYVG